MGMRVRSAKRTTTTLVSLSVSALLALTIGACTPFGCDDSPNSKNPCNSGGDSPHFKEPVKRVEPVHPPVFRP